MNTYMRWKAGEERCSLPGRFPPLKAGHPLVDQCCPVCAEPFTVGERVTTFAVGPDTPDDAGRHNAGRWYSALAVVLHERCAVPSGEAT